MMTKTIILAKYLEDTEWIADIPRDWHVVIMDGAPDAVEKVKYSSVFTPRKNYPTREVTAYLEAIIDGYNHILPEDIIVLAQARPFDHSPDFIKDIDKDSPYLSKIHRCTPKGLPHCTWGMMDEYCKELGMEAQKEYVFVEGAQLRLNGSDILSRPLAFYKKCYEIATKQETRDDGYFSATTFERLWLYIFNLPIPK